MKKTQSFTENFSVSSVVKKIFITPIGFAVLVIAFIILIRSLLARNAYEIVLSCTALLFFLTLGIIGTWRARKLSQMEPGWKPPYPMTANTNKDTIISGLDPNIPLFFRLHFEVKGNYLPSASSAPPRLRARYYAETSIPRNEISATLKIDFPMSGTFQGEGYCRLRDIFGFFSFPCGHTLHRTLSIRSSPCFGKDYYINAQSGAEDRRNKHSTDEERYYMREYTPGDRFRDINWKSSEKIDTLITRISPDNQEKVSRIEVHLRNFCATKNPSLEELWLLDRAKARLSHFLRNLREQQSSFIFDIKAANANSWEIETEEDLDKFLEDLASLPFVPPQNEAIQASGKTGEIYVFSTACDVGLQSFLVANQQKSVSLFMVQPNFSHREHRDTEPTEILFKRDFLLKGCLLHPRWLLRGKIKPMTVQAAKTEIIYAGTKI